MIRPSGDKATGAVPGNLHRSFPEEASQTCTPSLFMLADATVLPSAESATEVTGPRCSCSVQRACRATVSHMVTLLSWPASASVPPFGESAPPAIRPAAGGSVASLLRRDANRILCILAHMMVGLRADLVQEKGRASGNRSLSPMRRR